MSAVSLRVLWAALAVLWVVSRPGLAYAQAQASDGEPAGYRAAIDAAIAEYEAHNFAEARALFARAHGLYPNARTLRGQGMAEFELRNYGDAISFLEQALASKEKPLEGTLREGTEQLLARARSFVARLGLSIEPQSATVVVDGVPVELGGDSALVLKVGDHVLEFRAPGYVAERRELKVTGGEQQALRVTLPKIELATSSAGDQPEPEQKSSWYKSPWFWVPVGLVIAGGAAAGVFFATSGGSKQADAYGGGSNVVLDGP